MLRSRQNRQCDAVSLASTLLSRQLPLFLEIFITNRLRSDMKTGLLRIMQYLWDISDVAWSHSAGPCMCSTLRSLIKARLQFMTGGYQWHLAVRWMWTHCCSHRAYSLIHKVPHFFTSLSLQHLFTQMFSRFFTLFVLFSLLRHSREETVSAGFLHGKIGEFKGQLHVASLCYCTAVPIVINAAKLEKKEQGCSVQMSEANRWAESMFGFWAGVLNVAFPPLAHLSWSVTIWIKVITHKWLHC